MTKSHDPTPVSRVPVADELKSFSSGAESDNILPSTLSPEKFPALTVLNLSNSHLTEPPEISRLVTLVELDLSNNEIPRLPDSLRHCRRLRKLNLSNNNLTVFPSCLENSCHLLRELNVSGNALASVPQPACILQLKRLNCALNWLTSFPKWVFELNYYDLDELDLSENDIFRERLPTLSHFHVGYRRVIRRLILTNVRLNDSHLFVLSCFSGVEELEINYETASNASELTNQIIQFDRLREHAPHLKSLRGRNLGMHLRHIPPFKRLEKLDLSQNWFASFSQPLAVTSLVELRLASCEIASLPSNVGDCRALKILDLSMNSIVELPPSFFNLTSLEYLDLYRNGLEETNFISFTHLIALDVCQNEFEPPTFPLGQDGPSYLVMRSNLRSVNGCDKRLNGRKIIDSYSQASDDSKRSDLDSEDERENESTVVFKHNVFDEFDDDFWNEMSESNVDEHFDPRSVHLTRTPDVNPYENPDVIKSRCPLSVRASANFHVPLSSLYVPPIMSGMSDLYFDAVDAEQFEDA